MLGAAAARFIIQKNDESYSGFVFGVYSAIYGELQDVDFLQVFMDKEHEARIFDGRLIISERGGKTQTFDRLPEKDFGKKPKNKPLYVYDTRLPSRTFIEIQPSLAKDDAGDRIDSLIINYDYIAKILGITNGKRIYFNLHHNVTVPAEQGAIIQSYFITKWQEKCHIFSVAYELPQLYINYRN